MKDFTASPGRLRALSVGAKLLYSAFAISALLGLLVSYRLYGSIVGETGAASYYAGAPVKPPAAQVAQGEGPTIDLAEEDERPRVITEQISDRKLLEVTHFHLFSIPVYVLILAHLWLLARLPAWAHSSGVAAAIVASGLHVAAPWIVRGRPSWTPLMPISGILMLATLAVVALVPTIDMWLPRRPSR